MQSIADELGVTKMTVSNAFGHPDRVSPALRERILATAEQLGYAVPDASARALARGRTGTIGVLLTESPAAAFADHAALGLVAGIARALAARALSLVLLADRPAGEFLPARDVAMDGAVVYACSEDDQAVEWLRKRRLPIVTVDQPPTAAVDAVNVDDRGGAAAAAVHLAELGHRRIGAVLPWVDAPAGVSPSDPADLAPGTQLQRWSGWCDALAPYGTAPLVMGLPYELDRRTASELASRLLQTEPRPTAVLCFSDAIAAAVCDVAADLGLAVPEDLSVVGFDDGPVAEASRPALTTVRQDLDAKGAAAVELLFAALDAAAGAPRHAEHVVVPTELVVRESTGPVPPSAR